MATRESVDTTSTSGKSYPAGSAGSTGNTKGITLTKNSEYNTNSLLGKNGAFNGHAVEIWADGAVWDTVSSVYLRPGTDFNPGDVQKK